jgi:hypothetical protein
VAALYELRENNATVTDCRYRELFSVVGLDATAFQQCAKLSEMLMVACFDCAKNVHS